LPRRTIIGDDIETVHTKKYSEKGQLNAQAFRKLLRNKWKIAPGIISDAEVSRFITLLDPDGPGLVSIEDFMSHLATSF